MKRLITIGLMSLVLASAYSFVYACDHSAKAAKASGASAESATTVIAPTDAKTIRTLVVGATPGCPKAESIVSFDIDVPGRTTQRYIHIEAVEIDDKPSVLRTAMTLGRAFVTTIEAVMGSLLDAAADKTASFV